MHGDTKHEMRCTSTVGKHVRSKKHEIQSMNVRYTCMLDTRHERSTHAVKQKQRREAEIRDTEYSAVRCRVRRRKWEKRDEEEGRCEVSVIARWASEMTRGCFLRSTLKLSFHVRMVIRITSDFVKRAQLFLFLTNYTEVVISHETNVSYM